MAPVPGHHGLVQCPAPGYALGDATDAIERAARDSRCTCPSSFQTSFQGTAAAFAQFTGQRGLAGAGRARLPSISCWASCTRASSIPLTILSTLPSAGIGALLALWVTGSGLDVMGIIGLVLLIGIVKKNAIMMIDFALEAERVEGMTPLHSIRHAALLRFRPILMTTLAAMLGAVPMMLGTGTGSELRRPLGYRHCGRACGQPAADAVHHPRHLPADGWHQPETDPPFWQHG
ncbi:efflux RND transporter permease subunit [Komagataeibacter rhaeticus]